MKILLLCDNLNNSKQWIRGIEKYTDAKVKILHISGRNKFLRVFKFMFFLFTIGSKIRKLKPDIVIGYRITSYGFLAAWSGYKPFILAAEGETDVWPQKHWTTPFKAFLARYAIKRAELIHAWGVNMTPSIIKYGGKKDQFFVMPRGIDINLFTFNPILRKTNKNDLIHFCVSRSLFPEYGHTVILEAAKKLVSDGYKIKVFIVGTGPERERIEKFIAKNNLTANIELLGYIPNIDLPEILRKSEFYLSMPETEGVSTSLFEAMGCGCFPIISDLPANRGFIRNGENGYLVPIGDFNDLYLKIKTTMDSPELYWKAINNNRQLIEEKADMKKNMQQFVNKYQNIINSNKSCVV